VRALALASGAVSTLAGTGSAGGANGAAIFASFSAPSGIAVSASLGALVADAGGHTVRRIVCPSASPSATPTGTPSIGATASSTPTAMPEGAEKEAKMAAIGAARGARACQR